MSKTKTEGKMKKRSSNNDVEEFVGLLVAVELLFGLFVSSFPFLSAFLTLLALTQRDVQTELIILYIILLVAFIAGFLIPKIVRRLRDNE